jgi:NADPH-dependent curcumin reductase CurA
MKQTNTTNRRLVLAERPEGAPTERTLRLETTEIPSPQVFDAVLPQLNTGARVPVCGLVSQYNSSSLPEGPDRMGYLMGQILRKRITMRGFIIFEDFGSLYPEFAAEMGEWLKAGKVHYREEINDGLEQAPAAFIGMLEGRNFGKCVIRVGPSK